MFMLHGSELRLTVFEKAVPLHQHTIVTNCKGKTSKKSGFGRCLIFWGMLMNMENV